MESLNVGRISLPIEMIIYNQKCCKMNTFIWPLEKLKCQLKKNFLIDFHVKTFGTYFLILAHMAVFSELSAGCEQKFSQQFEPFELIICLKPHPICISTVWIDSIFVLCIGCGLRQIISLASDHSVPLMSSASASDINCTEWTRARWLS